MSSPLDRTFDRDRPSLYAPKWARKGPSESAEVVRLVRADEASADDAEDDEPAADPAPAPDQRPTAQDLMIERFRVPRSLEPTVMPEPWPDQRRRSIFGMLTRLGAALSAAAIVALVVVGNLPSTWSIAPTERIAEAAPAPMPARTVALPQRAVEQALPPAPQLVMAAAAPRPADDLIPLGLSLRDAGTGASVLITGLPAGSSLTTGRAFGPNAWRLSADDLGSAVVRPPRGFVGAVDLAAELRRADDTVADRRALRLEWIAAPAKEARPPAARRLDADEIAALIKRGEDFVVIGDLAAARLLLQRAAEAQDPRAALALAATYDPLILEQLGVKGLAGDAAAARAWYEKAKEFGSAEASRRLELLASRTR